MSEGEKILWNAINQIAWGSEDNEPPFRAAPREVLIELARKAIEECRHLTTKSSGPDSRDDCAWYGGDCGGGEKCSDKCYEPSGG